MAIAEDQALADYNRQLVAQIQARVQQGLSMALTAPAGSHVVIRHAGSGVLSVVGAAGASSGHDVVFGPDSFGHCLAHVNAVVVTRLAGHGSLEPHPPHPHPPPHHPPAPTPAPPAGPPPSSTEGVRRRRAAHRPA